MSLFEKSVDDTPTSVLAPITGSAVLSKEGWHILHLFFRVNYGQWSSLNKEEQAAARAHLIFLVQKIQAQPKTQLLTLSMVGSKADIGFVLSAPDLHIVDHLSKQLTRSLGPQILVPVLSWLSMTELSEYATTEAEYIENLKKNECLEANSKKFETDLSDFRSRMRKYSQDRLYPQFPNWPVVCFYPMSKRRAPSKNWYTLNFTTRKKLMAGHASIGRSYSGRIRQLITGSSGLDNEEWGVTLFARTTSDIKAIVYEMRFDPVSAEYAKFGEFFIGLQLSLEELCIRLEL